MKIVGIFILLSLFFAIGCTKTETPSNSEAQVFPNQIGDKWVYLFRQDTPLIEDTVDLEIVDQIIENGDTLKAWQRTFWHYNNSQRDTFWVSEVQDSVFFYPNNYRSWKEKAFVFPLQDGQSWEYALQTASVLDEIVVEVPAASFNSWQIELIAIGPNYALLDQKWFVPEVGLVKWTRSERNLGPAILQEYELINYQH